jgi:hypothetical protein
MSFFGGLLSFRKFPARTSIAAKAERSKAADHKAATKRTRDGFHSFRSLLADIATVTRNTMGRTQSLAASFVLYPTYSWPGSRVPTSWRSR